MFTYCTSIIPDLSSPKVEYLEFEKNSYYWVEDLTLEMTQDQKDRFFICYCDSYGDTYYPTNETTSLFEQSKYRIIDKLEFPKG